MPTYKPEAPTRPPTWIRVQDEFGQFDHRADLPLPDGQEVVEDYPKHVGELSRAPKSKVELKVDRDALKDLAKDLGVPIGNKSNGDLARAIAEKQAEQAAEQPAIEAEETTESTDTASGAGEGSE